MTIAIKVADEQLKLAQRIRRFVGVVVAFCTVQIPTLSAAAISVSTFLTASR